MVLIESYRPLRANDEGVANDANIEQFVGVQTELAGHFGGNRHL